MTHKTPRTEKQLASSLSRLRKARKRKKAVQKGKLPRRSTLSKADRQHVLEKTDRRCHICGGKIDGPWQADHVLAHSGGGKHSVDNYLPAHKLCNNYRWDYSDEEFQFILKLGVWTRTQIEKRTTVGQQIAERFLAHERARERRRKKV